MKKVVLLLALILVAIVSIGCTKPDCDEELAKLYEERNRAFRLCGDSFPCSRKVQAEFDEKEKRILENCN